MSNPSLTLQPEGNRLAFRQVFAGTGLDPIDTQWAAGATKNELCQRRGQFKRALTDLLDKAEAEQRHLTEAEKKAFDFAEASTTYLSQHIDVRMEAAGKQASANARGGDWIDRRTGRPIRVLAPSEPMAQADGETRDLTFGGLLRASVLGPATEAEQRALGEGSPTGGGFTVPTSMSAQLIDRMRAKAVFFQAGAKAVDMPTESLDMARLLTDPVASWHAEHAPIGDSDPTFGKITLRAKTLVSLVRISRELLEDTVNVEQALMNAFAQALALEVDRAAFLGIGAGQQPLGLFGCPDVNVVSMGDNGGALGGYDGILDGILKMLDANSEMPTAAIMAPRTRIGFEKLKDGDGLPLVRPPMIAALPFLSTTSIPVNQTQGTANNASSIFVGDFSQAMVGVRSQLRIDVLKERFAENFQFGFLAHLRTDIHFQHEEAFSVIKGVVPPA